MILSKRKCCLWLNGVSTESQKRTSVLQIWREISPTRNMTRIYVGLAPSYVKHGKIYVQFDGMVYQQVVGDSYGHKLCSTYSQLISILLREGFYGKPPAIQRFDLIDKFNDISRYLDDIFTIDNPEIVEHIPDIYPRELQLNKANISDKETSFLCLNIKVIGSNIHTSVYDKLHFMISPLWLTVGSESL